MPKSGEPAGRITRFALTWHGLIYRLVLGAIVLAIVVPTTATGGRGRVGIRTRRSGHRDPRHPRRTPAARAGPGCAADERAR